MAYNAFSISSAAHATVPFENASPTKYIWVSNKGSNGNTGSASAPMKTIQAAVDKAAPGTAIMIKSGTYTENVTLKTDGTTTKPIWLTSADGIGKAKVVAADNKASVIAGYGEDNWIIKGLATEGGKNGIQFSQSGSGLKNFSENVVIQENVIKNVKVADGIKLSQAKNHAVVGNHIEGGVGEEGIDNVYTTNSVIAYNTIKNTHGLSAITMKGGSANIKVHHNFIEGAKIDGILIGGYMGKGSSGNTMPNGLTYQAKHITVEHNEIHDVGKRPINVLGGQDSTVKHNWFDPQNSYNTVVAIGPDNMKFATKNVNFVNNIVSKDKWMAGKGAVNQNGNVKSGPWTEKTGADDLPGAAGSGTKGVSGTFGESPVAEGHDWKASGTATVFKLGTGTADSLTGTAANDHLDGNRGHDTLKGGGGDDTYVVGSKFDTVVEQEGEGVDTVHAYDTEFSLPAYVENLVVFAKDGAAIWDNAEDNMITAGEGQDTFNFQAGNGHDVIKGFEVGQDHIHLDGTVPVGEVKGTVVDGNLVLDLPGDHSITLMGVDDMAAMSHFFT